MLQQQFQINYNIKTCKVNRLCTFLYLVLLLIGFSSCTKQVEINLQNIKQEYGVNCLFSPEKSIELYGFKTSLITESTLQFVDDFEVELFENDSLLWLGDSSEAGKYSIPVYLEPNKEYKIVAKNKEGVSISASDFVPSKVSILTATYLFPVYEDMYGSKFGKVALSFNDISDIKNYYEIIILSGDSSVNYTFDINSFVINLDNENDPNPPGSILFTDELFEGEKLDLNIFVYAYNEPIIVLRNVSRNYYEYRKSITAHIYNQNSQRDDVYNLFKSDPLELYSNVSNGLGIFAAFSQDVKVCTKTDE